MRIKVLAFAALVFEICNPSVGFPQNSTSTASPSPVTVQRDAASLSLLSQVVGILGGSALSSTTGVVAQGAMTASTGGISGPIRWEISGTEFRYERPGPNGTTVFVSGHGNPAVSDGVTVDQNVVHQAKVIFPWHLPGFVLASQVNKLTVSIQSAQPVTINGVAAIKISFADLTDSLTSVICKQDWYLNANTLLPFRVDYLDSERNNALNTVQMTTLLSDYKQVGGALIPYHLTTYFQAQQIWDVELTQVQVGNAIPASDFDVPATTSGGQ
ncbi:MAG TPA: hypothetical protein VFI45_22455 [Candidatus Acidoferrum sp.]|nr:hypothetical protein [Candidatus Acidoferrum sp.]